MAKWILTGFGPNAGWKEAGIATRLLAMPWKWKRGTEVQMLEQEMAAYTGSSHAIAIDSARSGLQAALAVHGIGEGDEVLVQAYTCLVVINAIQHTGATPIYVDCTENYTMDVADAEKKITKNTKAIFIQHTFGIAADVDALARLARAHNLLSIEDCAQTIASRVNGKLLGTFADIGVYSFGADKMVSSVRGGMMVTNDSGIAQKLRSYVDGRPHMPAFMIIQHLKHLVVFRLGRALYGLGIGKALMAIAAKFKATARTVYEFEKQGQGKSFLPAQMPNALARIARTQLANLEADVAHRKSITALYAEAFGGAYSEEMTLNRYPLQVSNAVQVLAEAKKKNMLLGNWYAAVIAPPDGAPETFGYTVGSCPRAEKLATGSINLPNSRFITKEDALRIIAFVKTKI